ncbi:MAG TPA: BatD family protein [Gammaproteobacteria bacterium]
MVRRAAALAALALLVVAGLARAQDVVLEASVDRPTIYENESFTYIVRVEGALSGEPDASPLERQFDVLSRASSSRVQIVNGRASQVAEWTYQLMPKGTGEFTLPPLRVGNRMTNPVTVEVLPAPVAGDAPADIFMEVSTETTQVYVQSQVVYTLKLFVGVTTGRATLTPPEIAGGEAIVERLGEDRQYQTARGGRDFIVRERRYAIFPQEPGTLTVGPVTFEAMVIPNRGFSRVQRFRSGTVELEVLPAVPPPASIGDATWLPATALTLSERWSDAGAPLAVGVPHTRTVVVEADGLLETQLPELPIGSTEGIRQYPDQPELDREVTERGLRARRTERFAVIAQQSGRLELPPVELPWFNVTEGRWEVARLEPRVLEVEPAAAEPAPAAAPEPAAAPAPPVVVERPGIWPWVSAALAAGWLVTLLLWWRSSRALRGGREPAAAGAREGGHGGRRAVLKRLRAACAANDADAARRALLEWGEIRFPEADPRSLGALAALLPPAAGREVLDLEAHIYGAARRPWDGRGLAAILKELDAAERPGRARKSDSLAPLYR